MRRKDREVTDFNEITDIIQRCGVLHLGMVDDGKPYIVPLNYGYEIEGETVTFYFHSAKEGRKMDILRKNPGVCFAMECSVDLYKEDLACNWTAQHETVMGEGEIRFIEEPAEKEAAFTNIMHTNGYQGKPVFHPVFFEQAQLYALKVSKISGKKNIRSAEPPK